MNMITALLVAPGTAPYTIFVEDSKEAMEGVIGSELAVVYPWETKDAAIVFAMEQQDKEYNRVLLSEKLLPIGLIRGSFMITGSQPNREGLKSLSAEQIETFTKMFAIPDRFRLVEDGELLIEKAVITEGIAMDADDEETQEE